MTASKSLFMGIKEGGRRPVPRRKKDRNKGGTGNGFRSICFHVLSSSLVCKALLHALMSDGKGKVVVKK